MVPLWQLCFEGKLERVRFALRGGEDVNSRDEDNKTALMWAVEKKHNGIVRLLLQQPAIQVNDKCRNVGETALHMAANINNVEAMQLLLANQQIEVNCQNNEGATALHCAAVENVEAMQLLLANEQVDVNLKDKEGNTALLYCDTVETMQLLLANQQVDVNTADNDGDTGLHVAAQDNDAEMIRMLLAHPQFNSANHVAADGKTPAMVAAAQQNGDALRELVSHQSVDLDLLDGGGRSLNQIATWFVGQYHFHIEGHFPFSRVPQLHPISLILHLIFTDKTQGRGSCDNQRGKSEEGKTSRGGGKWLYPSPHQVDVLHQHFYSILV